MTDQKNTSKFINATTASDAGSKKTTTQADVTFAVLNAFGADTRSGANDKVTQAIKTVARYKKGNIAQELAARAGVSVASNASVKAKPAGMTTGRM